MTLTINDTVREAAAEYLHWREYANPGDGTCDSCRETTEGVLGTALPLLTAEDVPHIVAQALRDAADQLPSLARRDSAESWGLITAERHLRACADQYADAHRSSAAAVSLALTGAMPELEG